MKRKAINKKGSVWISAALYFGLGIVVLSIILAAGMPVINKLRDKNVAIQTKEVFFKLDNSIREVARGGPGTQRLLHVEIKKGDLSFTGCDESKILWQYETKAMLSEPEPIDLDEAGEELNATKEGNLRIITKKMGMKGKYLVKMWLDYDEVDVVPHVMTVKGGTDLVVSNRGDAWDNDDACDGNNKIDVEIREKS